MAKKKVNIASPKKDDMIFKYGLNNIEFTETSEQKAAWQNVLNELFTKDQLEILSKRI